MKKVHLIGFNLLIEKIEQEKQSPSGIFIQQNEDGLIKGIVKQCGPGFMIPAIEEDVVDDFDAIVNGNKNVKPKFIPLDVKELDSVYFHEKNADLIWLDGKSFYIVPYPAIKLFIRDEI